MSKFIKIKTYYWDKTLSKTMEHKHETLINVDSIMQVTPNESGETFSVLTTSGHMTSGGEELKALYMEGNTLNSSEKLRIAIDALEEIRADIDQKYDSNFTAYNALEKIREIK